MDIKAALRPGKRITEKVRLNGSTPGLSSARWIELALFLTEGIKGGTGARTVQTGDIKDRMLAQLQIERDSLAAREQGLKQKIDEAEKRSEQLVQRERELAGERARIQEQTDSLKASQSKATEKQTTALRQGEAGQADLAKREADLAAREAAIKGHQGAILSTQQINDANAKLANERAVLADEQKAIHSEKVKFEKLQNDLIILEKQNHEAQVTVSDEKRALARARQQLDEDTSTRTAELVRREDLVSKSTETLADVEAQLASLAQEPKRNRRRTSRGPRPQN